MWIPNVSAFSIKLNLSQVTTNSQEGVREIEQYYPVFEAMEAHDLVLNIHGEIPDAAVLDAEAGFIPQLYKLHSAFPRLRIVLEHVSTREGIEAVRKCGAMVRRIATNKYKLRR